MPLSNIKALTFDCYGTLIDWEQGILGALRPWASRQSVDVSDDELLAAFADAESQSETETPAAPYPDILRCVHGRIAARFGVPVSNTDADSLAQSVGDWPVFDDTVDALQRLKQHHKLIIMSNIDRASFARTNEQLGMGFDAVVTAEDVGAYKPDHRMFLRAFEIIEGMGFAKSEALHVAQSLFHDHAPAKQLGLTTCWVDRRRGMRGSGATPVPDRDVHPDYVVGSLAELVALLGIDPS